MMCIDPRHPPQFKKTLKLAERLANPNYDGYCALYKTGEDYIRFSQKIELNKTFIYRATCLYITENTTAEELMQFEALVKKELLG